MKLRNIYLDLDDTLCNIDERKKYYGVDWNRYNELIYTDKINSDVYDYVYKTLRGQYDYIVILTGRYVNTRKATEDWLMTHHCQFDAIETKPMNDNRSSIFFKIEYLEKNATEDDLVIDDRPEIFDWCENHGIKCIHVNREQRLTTS